MILVDIIKNNYRNHSCSPNTHVNIDKFHVEAVVDIPIGTELTFFYPSTEWDMSQPFKCWCGSKNVCFILIIMLTLCSV